MDAGTPDKPSEITISDDILAKAPVGLNNPDMHRREKAIGFLQALRIPVCTLYQESILLEVLSGLTQYVFSYFVFRGQPSIHPCRA